MKDLGDVIKIRAQQYNRIRKAQMTIAIIDATVSTSPRFAEDFDDYEGDVATDFPPLESLEQNPLAQFN